MPVTAVPGEAENLKVTVADDLARAEEVLRRRASHTTAPARA
jgi:2-C-methyl-D-erythritol 4-phosphate cytidylyltransferase